MRRWVAAVAPLLAIFLVAGAGAAATSPRGPPSIGVAPGPAIATDAVVIPVSADAQPLPASTLISLTLTLTNPHAADLTRFLSQVEDPTSPMYHQFLSFPQFVERFAPPVAQVRAVESALTAAGGENVAATPDRTSVSAVLPAGSVERLLGVALASYGAVKGMPLYTAVGSTSLPPSLEGLVAGVSGLSDHATAEFSAQGVSSTLKVRTPSHSLSEFVHDNTTGEDWFVGSDYTQEYGATQLFPGPGSVPNATYPRSVAVATLLVSAYNQTFGEDLPPWDPAVIDAYFNGTLGPGWPVSNLTGVPVPINGVVPPLPGSFGSVNDTTPYETENSLDLEMAGSLAPGASLFNFYFAASLLTGSVSDGDVATYFATALEEALAYPYGTQHLAAVSCSFGLSDLENPAWDAALATAASTGVTVVAASGDQGNAPDSLTGRSDGQWPVWPASEATDIYGALSVGGVSLSLSGTPSAFYNGSPLNLSYDPHDGGISSVSAWYDTSGGSGQLAGTEGGVSTVFPEPTWQFHSAAESAIVNVTLAQGASTLGRSGPDLAMPGNMTLATTFANATGTVFFDILEGTSIAAPVLAGLFADVVAVENNGSSSSWTSLGFIDPEVYRFASFFATHPAAPGDPFVDVTAGNNYVFSASPGWDATTGWGEVEAPALLVALHNATLLGYVYTGPTPLLPILPPSTSGNIPWPVIFAIFGVGIVVAIILVAVAARPSRPAPPMVPWGAQGGVPPVSGVPGQPGTAPGATFLCPYCGAIRPAEPVRCPQCGAL